MITSSWFIPTSTHFFRLSQVNVWIRSVPIDNFRFNHRLHLLVEHTRYQGVDVPTADRNLIAAMTSCAHCGEYHVTVLSVCLYFRQGVDLTGLMAMRRGIPCPMFDWFSPGVSFKLTYFTYYYWYTVGTYPLLTS